MLKSEWKFLVFIALFVTAAIVNTQYLWIPASAPIVLLVLFTAAYAIWEHKYGNKA
jgi:hypothetical protein